jgi:hypothetical protein
LVATKDIIGGVGVLTSDSSLLHTEHVRVYPSGYLVKKKKRGENGKYKEMTYIIERRYCYLSNNKEEMLLENRIRNIKTKRKG